MSEEKLNANSLSNLLVQVSESEVNEVVKAEDLSGGSQIDWESIFFEPKPGESYLLKFLPNIDQLSNGINHNIVHRSYYKDLPDPDRRGKTFAYTAPQGFDTKKNLLLSLFLDLNDAKKAGDVIAEKKIEKYLSRKQQACCKVQILKTADKNLIGKIMLFRFHTYGQNAHIANLINQKLNPSKADLDEGFVKENIFDIFDSPILSVQCDKTTFLGKEGRDMSKSKWAMKRSDGDIKMLRAGATVFMPEGFEGDSAHKFSKADLNEDGSIKESVKPYLEELARQISDESISIYRYFEPKEIGDPRNSEEDNEWLRKNFEKVLIVRDKIRNCSLEELSNLGPEVSDKLDKKSEAPASIENSIPDEDIPDELKDLESGVSKPSKSEEDSKVMSALNDDLEDF